MGKITNRKHFYLLITVFFLPLLYTDLSMAIQEDIISDWDEQAIKEKKQSYNNKRKNKQGYRQKQLKNKKRHKREDSPKYVTTRTYRRYTLKPYKSPLHSPSIYQTNYNKKQSLLLINKTVK